MTPPQGKGSQNRGGNKGGGNKGGGNANRRRQPKKNRRRRGRPQGVGFWGDTTRLPDAVGNVRISEDPAAVVRSLGPPPLPGREQVAEHYFAAIYDRAVMIGGALAAAGGLIETEDLTEKYEEDDD